jgi:peptidoglycan/LPS O-acetylase OafA/YrhL
MCRFGYVWDGLELGLQLWLNLSLYFAVLVGFSILSFRCVETPMRKLIAGAGSARCSGATPTGGAGHRHACATRRSGHRG